MIKKPLFTLAAASVAISATTLLQAAPVVTNPNIRVKPAPHPKVPRGPRLTPQQRGAINIVDVSDVSSGYTSQGTVMVNGLACPRTILLFPEVEAKKPVNGQVAITDRNLGVVGSARFRASNFVRRGGRLLVQPTIVYTPDWQAIGANYQFSFTVNVNSSAGTNWRTEKQSFYHRCSTASGSSKK